MKSSQESALVLGIDIGTSGVRAVLMNSKFDVVAQSSSLMSDFDPNHRSPVVWWKSMESALEQLRMSYKRCLKFFSIEPIRDQKLNFS